MDNFINNEEIKYFLKYKPQTWVVLKKIQKEKKDELTQLESQVSKMNIDMDIDTNTTNKADTDNNSNKINPSNSSANAKPIVTSNELIELENTLNNYEVDYQQIQKKKGPLIVDLSEDPNESNEVKNETVKEEASQSNENDVDNEMFKSTSTFNLANVSKDSLFQSQDSLGFPKNPRPLIIELDANNENTSSESMNTDTPKIDAPTSSNTNTMNENSNKPPRLDENVEWIEKLPMVKSLDGSVPINKVINELKPSTENQMQVDEEKLDSFFKFTEEENRMMTNLPNIEFNIVNEKALYLGLVDLLYAYSYDYRTTEGESTVESPWTIVNLSSSLSCFDTFSTLKETLIACIRRSLCYPLYRNFDLSMKCVMDVYVLFKLGKIAILKALLHMKKLFESQESYYIYNRCWIDDYCIWVQRCSKKRLKSLASELHTFKVPKQEIGFDLEECEMIAKEIDAIEEDE